jgi:FtsH-binding integral membrane protein
LGFTKILGLFLTEYSLHISARVYAILAGQLLVTAGSIFLFGTQPNLRLWALGGSRGSVVPIVSLLISTVSWAIICSSADARRKAPLKWWLLGLFTLGEAVSVGFITSFYAYRSVLSAMLATSVATVSVSLYTAMQKQSKYDLSQWGAGLSS